MCRPGDERAGEMYVFRRWGAEEDSRREQQQLRFWVSGPGPRERADEGS